MGVDLQPRPPTPASAAEVFAKVEPASPRPATTCLERFLDKPLLQIGASALQSQQPSHVALRKSGLDARPSILARPVGFPVSRIRDRSARFPDLPHQHS